MQSPKITRKKFILFGLFLNPPFKELNFLYDEKKHVEESVKALIDKINEKYEQIVDI